MSTSIAVSVKISPEQKKRFSELASKTMRSSHFLMREGLEAHLAKLEWEQSFHEEAEAALENYRLTGDHVSLDAAEKWLSAGAIGPMPVENRWRK